MVLIIQRQGVGVSSTQSYSGFNGYSQTYSQGTYNTVTGTSSQSVQDPNTYDSLGRVKLPSGTTGYRPSSQISPPYPQEISKYAPIPIQNVPTPPTASAISIPNRVASLANNTANYYSNNSETLRAARYVSNTPVAQNLGRTLASAGNNAGNAIAAVQIAAQTTRNVTEALKNPSARNIANTGLDVAIPFLLALPNPYAKGLGALLLAGKSIYDIFNPIDNLSPVQPTNNPLGGQTLGVTYNVKVNVVKNDGTNQDLEYLNLQGKISGFSQVSSILGFYYGADTASPVFQGVGSTFVTDLSKIRFVSVVRSDGTIEGDGNQPLYELNVNNDGFVPPNFDELTSRLDGIEAAINSRNLSDFQKDDILQAIRDALPKNNNGVTPRAENRTPSPLPVGSNRFVPANQPIPNTTPAPTPASLPKSGTPTAPSANNSVDKVKDKIKEIEKLSQTQSEAASKPVTKPDTSNRFKDPKDCNFSCENLAKCFVDLKVNIFDGCDATSGTAKTKEITIQVLPKDKAKTQASFQELLDIRSRECSLADRVLTVPEYWQVRIGQRPQAVVLYREFLNGKFTNTCYQLSIPHYNGTRKSKPNLTQYSKGECSAIYLCKDNSRISVYASTDAEAKRLINELEKLMNPTMRGGIVHTGSRSGIKKTTIKPVRLDYFSTGQTKLSPDWSVDL